MDDPKDLKAGLPVAGYRPQSDAAIALVNEFKCDEERLLRKIDALALRFPPAGSAMVAVMPGAFVEIDVNGIDPDKRWLAIAKSHFEQGFMALNRSVFKPARVKLPEDEA